MDGLPDAPGPVPADLKAELDRSQADLAAGRVRPLGPVLAAICDRASQRIAMREQVVEAHEERSAEHG